MKRLVVILSILLILAAAVFVLTDRGRIGGFFRPLPFTGPRHGAVTEAETGRPIAGAKLTAEWWCHDVPIPDVGGSYFVRTEAVTGADGRYRLDPPVGRRGLFGQSFILRVTAKARQSAAVFIVKPREPLPPSTTAWPFTQVIQVPVMAERLDFPLQPALPVILKALDSDNPQYRQVAAQEIGRLGAAPTTVFPALARALADPEPQVRRAAAEAFERLGAADPPARASLAKALADPETWVRVHAAKALAVVGPDVSNVPDLIRALADQDPWVRRYSARALGRLGPQAREASPALRQAARERDWRVRQDAAEALRRVEAEGP